MKNAINWFEIPASDIDRARKFYEGIFDFEMFDLNIGDGLSMVLFPAVSGTVNGALIQYEDMYKPSDSMGPLLYLNANPDVQTVLDRVEEAGGKILIPKRLITEDNGYMAVIIDSEGNRIALHSNN
ncbi:VOC family protein [Gracilimonas amylolytica]|uniref:VOC family protein n=1 Tax=Gracilimonas amylolytica TaxID=1749045 RepID=UPI000CD811AB|nr:VOC family protein [Gracilimonas amylolytica]